MRARKSFFLTTILLGTFAGLSSAQTANQAQVSADAFADPPVTTINQALDRILAREHDEDATIRRYSPIVETYMQDMKPDKEIGTVPVHDHYFLGKANFEKGIVDNSMLAKNKGQMNPLSHLSGFSESSHVPESFLRMIYLDADSFDRRHYRIDYVRREFLGGIRCLVFDVTPLPKSGKGRFKGRIWAEDQGFTIVRFNGVYTPLSGVNGLDLYFDSWRLNVQPGLWLPALIFSQESDPKDFLGNHLRFKSQTRFWGYDLKDPIREEEFSQLTIESPAAIQDRATEQQDRSPFESEREWQNQAEINVVDRLQRIGLFALPSSVDKVLDTVVNNLEVTNNLDIEPEVHCRVLLTSTLEAFTIGHTIVLSRGLIDVLPDEASLATMIAGELADIIVNKTSIDQWGFNGMGSVSTVEALSHFAFRDSPDEVQLAGQKALELLDNSPYNDKLSLEGLFLGQLDAESRSLPALINPRLANRVAVYTQLINSGPQRQMDKPDQISALPIGGRVKLDPWSDQIELLKTKAVPALSAREKMPFQITPFEPFLTRYGEASADVSADAGNSDVAQQQQQPVQQK